MRVRLLHKSKPNNYTGSCGINVAGGWRERNVSVPGEICMERSERSKRRTRKRGGAERAEVSRGHSSRQAKGRISRSPEYDRERGNARMDAENISKDGCSQRDSAEHEGHVRAHRSFNRIWKERDSAQPDLLEKMSGPSATVEYE